MIPGIRNENHGTYPANELADRSQTPDNVADGKWTVAEKGERVCGDERF